MWSKISCVWISLYVAILTLKIQLFYFMTNKTGLYIHGRRGNKIVVESLMRFAKWLRTRYEFPIRLNVYFSPFETVTAPWDGDRENVSIGWFPCIDFNQVNIERYPRVLIATGDFDSSAQIRGQDNALASYISEFGRWILCYQDWVSIGYTADCSKYNKKSAYLLRQYEKITDHP